MTLTVKEVWSNADDWLLEDQHLATVYVDFECGCWTSNEMTNGITGPVATRDCTEGHQS